MSEQRKENYLTAVSPDAILWACLKIFGKKSLSICAASPHWFASAAKMAEVEVEMVESGFDFGGDCDIDNLYFESFEPKKGWICYQNFGEKLGDYDINIFDCGSFAAVSTKDCMLLKELKDFLGGGIKEGRLWNFDLRYISLNLLCQNRPLPTKEEIQKSNDIFFAMRTVLEKGNRFFDPIECGDKTVKRFFPLLLKPSMYCVKEDIFERMRQLGYAPKVHYKPIYRLKPFASSYLSSAEELYKAEISLPLEIEAAEAFLEICDEYSRRGCSF